MLLYTRQCCSMRYLLWWLPVLRSISLLSSYTCISFYLLRNMSCLTRCPTTQCKLMCFIHQQIFQKLCKYTQIYTHYNIFIAACRLGHVTYIEEYCTLCRETQAEIQYNTIQYNTIQYNTIQYNTIQYNTIQYNTITLYSSLYGQLHFVEMGNVRTDWIMSISCGFV